LYDFEHPKVVEPKNPPVQQPLPPKNQEESSGILRRRQNFTDQ
jgi:hypothetical protein